MRQVSIGHIEKLALTRELSVLLKSGVPLSEALQSMQSKARLRNTKRVIDGILLDVENGQSLSHALSRFPKVFDSLYVNLVQIGETSGTLNDNLEFLSRQLDNAYTLRKKIQGIVLYPALVLSFALLLGAAISIFILPRLIRLFDSFNVALPLATRILLSIAAFMQSYGGLFFASIAGVLLVWRGVVALPKVKPYWHRFLLSLPLVGTFFRDIATAHLCRDMGVMLQSGLPLLEALMTEERVIHDRAFAGRVSCLAQAVSQGKSLAEELTNDRYSILSPLASKMIASGEKTGRLGETFLYLETFFENEVDRKIKNMTVLFEPILLIGVGLIVIFLALAILTPIYSLTGSVRR